MSFRFFVGFTLLLPGCFANDESTCTSPLQAESEAHGPSLLQAHRTSPTKGTVASFMSLNNIQVPKPAAAACPLPAGATWCQVRLANLAPYWMAVYESGAGAMAANNDWVSWNICNMGFWEDQDIGIFGAPGSMLDIGGNVGYHTFAFAQAGWTVNSFEPMAPNLALQAATMCANPSIAARVTINPHGLGTAPQTCQMVSPINNVGDGFTKCGAEGEALTDSKFKVVGSFKIRRLEGVLQEKRLAKVDLVKIDVEGYEAQVFAGAPNFLAQYRPRLIKSEVWGQMTGSSGMDFLTMFANAGYRFFTDGGCTIPHAYDVYATGDVFMCLTDPPAALVTAPAQVKPAQVVPVPPAVPAVPAVPAAR